jgi:F-type H+-transporting ATPase subunit b
MRIPASILLALLALPGFLAAQEGGGLFDPDPGLGIWTIVVFLLVLFVLGKWAWGPILGAVESREEGIRESIAEARKMQEDAHRLLEQHKQQLADARRQAQEIVNEGREAGDRVRKEMEERARAESDRILERARTEIARERDQALEAIRAESVDLALALAGRILKERLDTQADRELVERYLSQVDTPSVEA